MEFLFALAQNEKIYRDIQAGYKENLAELNAAEGRVLGSIGGIQAARAQEIADAYTQESGRQAQGLVSRGLGNTTVANAVERGLTLDKAKADSSLAAQMAQLTGGYQTQFAGMRSGLRDRMTGALASLRSPMLGGGGGGGGFGGGTPVRYGPTHSWLSEPTTGPPSGPRYTGFDVGGGGGIDLGNSEPGSYGDYFAVEDSQGVPMRYYQMPKQTEEPPLAPNSFDWEY